MISNQKGSSSVRNSDGAYFSNPAGQAVSQWLVSQHSTRNGVELQDNISPSFVQKSSADVAAAADFSQFYASIMNKPEELLI